MKTNYESVGALPEQSLEKNAQTAIVASQLRYLAGAEGAVPKTPDKDGYLQVMEKKVNLQRQAAMLGYPTDDNSTALRNFAFRGASNIDPENWTKYSGTSIDPENSKAVERGEKFLEEHRKIFPNPFTNIRKGVTEENHYKRARNSFKIENNRDWTIATGQPNPQATGNELRSHFANGPIDKEAYKATKTSLNVTKGKRKGPIVTDSKEPLKEHPSTQPLDNEPFFGDMEVDNELRTRQQDIANGKINPGKPEAINGNTDGTVDGTKQNDTGTDEKSEQSENNPK